MKRRATAMFAIIGWDEKPYNEAVGLPKLTRASVTKTFSGDLEGESQLEYLMVYRADGTASFVAPDDQEDERAALEPPFPSQGIGRSARSGRLAPVR
jgi:hypothetical protein